jgi:hypothetical protein
MKPGLFNVGSYQVSGAPWITGSNTLAIGGEDRIIFPRTAKSVTVINTDPAAADDLRVHFNSTGSGNVVGGLHFVQLNNNNDSVSLGVKCKEIFISNAGPGVGAYTVIAELTSIPSDEMFDLTGSGLTE